MPPAPSPRRPTVWQWLRYSVGSGLPGNLAGWVLHDTTCRSWALRQVARSLLVISPLIVVLLVLVPGRSRSAPSARWAAC